jgi:hypothetical protein
VLKTLAIEGKCFNIMKAKYNKTIANIILNGGKLKPYPLKSGTRQMCVLSTLLSNIGLEFLAREIRKGKK